MEPKETFTFNFTQLYTPIKVDGRELLKSASLEDVRQWLWENYRTVPVEYSVLKNFTETTVQEIAIRDGLRKLQG